ncbi:MAG: hypothetical protein HYX26_07865 [Acidobacteriales bacterium]|nr:hypothetical protein [Terriglobales bacterium]
MAILQTGRIGQFVAGLLWATALLILLRAVRTPSHNAFASFMELSNYRSQFITAHQSFDGPFLLQKVFSAIIYFCAGALVYVWSVPREEK